MIRRWVQWPQRSLQNKIFVSILLFLIIPFCVTFYFIDQPLERTIREKIGQSAQEALQIAKLNVEGALTEMMSSVTSLMANELAINILKNPGAYHDYDRLKALDGAVQQMYSSYLQNMENNITVLDFHGHLYASWQNQIGKYDEIRGSDWFQAILDSEDHFVWIVHEKGFISRISGRLITVARVQRSADGGPPVGVAMSTVAANDLVHLFRGLEGDVMLTGPDGRLLAANRPDSAADTDFFGSEHFRQILNSTSGQLIDDSGGEKTIVNYTTISMTGWKLIQRIPYDSVFQDIFRLRRINIFVAAGIFLLFLLISITISFGVTRPLKLLRQKMKQVEYGHFHPILTVRGNDEVADLIRAYNTMIARIKELIEHVKTEQKHRENMRFKALQAQINPHFLLNTLNNIKWMAYMRQDREVGDMLSHLGVIMESSVGKGEDIIPLGEEIRYIQSYVALQKIKYDERIEVHYDLPDEVLQAHVIKFTLQPLVENSIYHGLDKKRGKGIIRISACAEDGDLVIAVEDNGLGIPPLTLDTLRKALEQRIDLTIGDKLGLANVHERIRMQFGDRYGIRLESREHEGTTVTVRMPFIPSEEGSRDAEGPDRG